MYIFFNFISIHVFVSYKFQYLIIYFILINEIHFLITYSGQYCIRIFVQLLF